jgi:hypothetical protein
LRDGRSGPVADIRETRISGCRNCSEWSAKCCESQHGRIPAVPRRTDIEDRHPQGESSHSEEDLIDGI